MPDLHLPTDPVRASVAGWLLGVRDGVPNPSIGELLAALESASEARPDRWIEVANRIKKKRDKTGREVYQMSKFEPALKLFHYIYSGEYETTSYTVVRRKDAPLYSEWNPDGDTGTSAERRRWEPLSDYMLNKYRESIMYALVDLHFPRQFEALLLAGSVYPGPPAAELLDLR